MRLRVFIVCLCVIFTTTAPIVSIAATDWKHYARQLHAENEKVFEEARSGLNAIPDLDQKLRAAIADKGSEDQRIALDAIGILHRHELIGDVLKLARQESDGIVFATIRVLAEPADSDSVFPVLQARLSKSASELSAGAKIEILSSFQKLNKNLEPAVLEALLEDPSFEVRIAAVDLAGFYRVDRKQDAFDKVLVSAVGKKPYQLRLESLRWIDKTPKNAAVRRKPMSCMNDAQQEVRDLCKKVSS